MPNWCTNFLHLDVDIDNNPLIEELLSWAEITGRTVDNGQLPIPNKEGEFEYKYMFDLSVQDNIIQFNTKWSPDVEMCIAIAKKYKFSFLLAYEEAGEPMFGEYKYDLEAEVLTERYLPVDIQKSILNVEDGEETAPLLEAELEKLEFKKAE